MSVVGSVNENGVGDCVECDDRIPGTCPVCGAISLSPDQPSSTLLAVCDVLVIKSLESIGKRILRAERSRFRQFGNRPRHIAHTVWPPSEEVVEKALRGAWDVVDPLLVTHGCCDVTVVQVSDMLDSYVTDLVITGTPHTIEQLAYRFTSRLSLPVYLQEYTDEPAVADA